MERDDEPLVRARHMKALLDALSALDASMRDAVSRRVDPVILDARHATATAWLPLQHCVELTRAISQTLGPRSARRFYRHTMRDELDSSLFRSFVAMVSRMLGLGPDTFVKMAPKGWGQIYRGAGTLESIGEERIRYSSLPPMCCEDDTWVEAVGSAFHASFDLAGVEGSIVLEDLDLAEGRVTYCFRW